MDDQTTFEAQQVAKAQAEAARALLARRCFCEYCVSHQEHARKHIESGPVAVLKALANPVGIICGGVESMMDEASRHL